MNNVHIEFTKFLVIHNEKAHFGNDTDVHSS